MSRFHRLQAEESLHRPERTGVGNPNNLTFDLLTDGQYYQDTLTGSLWRYYEEDDVWELLIGYDRGSNKITNFTVGFQTSKIGETTAVIGKQEGNNSGTITSVPMYLYTQVRAGEDLVIIDTEDSNQRISLTVSEDTNAGEVSVPVQTEVTQLTFQVGSSVELEGTLLSAYQSTDPTKIQQGVERRDEADGVGLLAIGISSVQTGVTSISLQEIDAPVILRDNQKLIIKNRAGEFQALTVNGTQTLSSATGSLTVDAFDPSYTYESTTTTVYEPAYASGTRITQTQNSIELIAESLDDTINSVASVNLYASQTYATISAFSSFETNTSSAISGLVSNASAQQASIDLFAQFQDATNSSIAAINATANTLGAGINTSVQYNDTGAYIQLLAGPDGSEITLEADQINIVGVITAINNDGTTTIDGDKITTGSITANQIDVTNLFSQSITITSGGYIQSSVFSPNTSGFKINSDGSAEFNGVTNLKSNTGRFVDKLLVESTSTTTGFGLEYSGVERFKIYALSDRVQLEGSGSYITGGQTYSRYMTLNSTSSVFGGESAQTVFIPQVNVFNSQPVVNVRPRLSISTGATIGTAYTGRLYIGGDVRWDGTTSTGATAGSNGDVPAQVAGYLLVNISGTNYKLPYYNS